MNRPSTQSRARTLRAALKSGLVGAVLLAACAWSIRSFGHSRAQVPPFTPNAPATQALYVGSAACAQCHKQQATAHAASSMAQSLFIAADSRVLQANPALTFRHGAWAYEIKRAKQGSVYTVSDGTVSFSAPILWAFGRGHSGQTFIVERDGVQYETRVSFFTERQALDFTPGAPRSIPASLVDAIGQRLSQPDALSCFSCHATVAPGAPRFALDHFTPGVGCETCHGPGAQHIALMKDALKASAKPDQPPTTTATTTTTTTATPKAIFNPRAMHPDDLSQQLCGACHRSWEVVMGMPGHAGQSNVRFQPYRLANSRCYKDPDDRRISCTACHDPHADPQRNASFYDAKCTACHQNQPGQLGQLSQSGQSGQPGQPGQSGQPGQPGQSDSHAVPASATAPRCPVGKANCASCHMPKVEAPGVHFKFTDHWIRVVRPGESYPN